MKTREEAYEIICDLNEEAHAATWNDWEAAEALDEDGKYDEAEDAREEASEMQAYEFREAFQVLMPEDQEAVLHWVKHDEDFAEEFNAWWGER
jgi:hypothetical protein